MTRMCGKALILIAFVAIFGVQAGVVKKLTPAQIERLNKWTPDDKQNIWQLSGQFQGDMILNENQRNGLIDEGHRWPNRELPYEFDASISQEVRNYITETLKRYEEVSCVKTRPRRPEDRDYVHVTNENTGCWSYVGRIGGQQLLNLHGNSVNSGCVHYGIILHEFLHAWGFHHQHSATERDDFVNIHWGNIEPGRESAFNKYASNYITSFGEKYDYGSVMHYDEYAFSSNGQKTITPKDPNAHIGQRNNLSPSDISKLKKMYKC